MQTPWIIRPIRQIDDATMQTIIHEVMTEHGCESGGFALHDEEVKAMSQNYQRLDTRYYVITKLGIAMGGAGFAPLNGTAPNEGLCELRKMYFQPQIRGLGLGQALLELLIDEMRLAGFRRCYLETTSWMERAQALYRRAGFQPQPEREGNTGHHGCDTFFSRMI
jgi:putative acetyltransferase